MLFGLFAYAFITTYVFLAPYYLLTKKYCNAYSFVDRLLGAFVLGISQIILTEVVLGFALQLVSLHLFLLNIAVSTSILIFAGIRREQLLTQFREAGRSLANFFSLVFEHKVLSIILVLSVAQMAWWAFQAWLFPPYAWDAMLYHLPKVAHILQSNGIEEFAAGSIWVNTYPFNVELLFLWNVIFVGNDVLANATQIAFALFAVLAVYGIARKVGVKPKNASFAMILLFVPIVIQQATTCYIDLAVSSLLIIAVNFMLLKDRPKMNLIILGLAVGVMIGAKGSFILPGLVVSLMLFMLILHELRNEGSTGEGRCVLLRKRFLGSLCLYAVPVLLAGGIWYARSWVLYSSPVAPIEVGLFGKTIFGGSHTLTDISHGTPVFTHPYSIINSWFERSGPGWDLQFYSYEVGSGGFGPMFPILLLPSILFSLFIAFRERWRRYLVVSAVFVLAFFVVPTNWWSRTTIFLSAFGVLSFTAIMEHLPNARTIARIAIPIVVFTLIVGNAHSFYTPERTADFIQKPSSERQASNLCIYWERYCDLFETMPEESGITILYTDVPFHLSYYLWDSYLTNKVFHIPRQYSSYEEFIAHIEGFGESRIFTTQDSDVSEFSEAHQNEFQLVYEKDNWRIISYFGGYDVQE